MKEKTPMSDEPAEIPRLPDAVPAQPAGIQDTFCPRLQAFPFSGMGMPMESHLMYGLILREDPSGRKLILLRREQGMHPADAVEAPFSEKTLTRPSQLFRQPRFPGRDGFHRSDPNIMDGTMFSLHSGLDDGQSVSASGSNTFPKGLWERQLGEYFDAFICAASGNPQS